MLSFYSKVTLICYLQDNVSYQQPPRFSFSDHEQLRKWQKHVLRTFFWRKKYTLQPSRGHFLILHWSHPDTLPSGQCQLLSAATKILIFWSWTAEKMAKVCVAHIFLYKNAFCSYLEAIFSFYTKAFLVLNLQDNVRYQQPPRFWFSDHEQLRTFLFFCPHAATCLGGPYLFWA